MEEFGSLARQIAFHDIDSFIQEVEDDAADIDDGIVRCDYDVDDKAGAKGIFLRASYTVGIGWRVFAMDCGTSPPSRGDRDGMDVFREMADRIRATCEESGLRCKRGIVF